LAERGTVARNPFILLLEIDSGWIYYEDRKVGEHTSICKPAIHREDCLVLDARGYGNLTTAIEETYRSSSDPIISYKLLTNAYSLCGVDTGYVEKGSASDLIIYDLKNPLKTAPIKTQQHMFAVIARSQQPDIVLIGGDVFYEHGENLAIPIVKVNELVRKKLVNQKNLGDVQRS
ncbi:MAG: hypothetical protein QXW94_03350, partial [Desulfurococcaceae archaeon]